MTDRGFCDVRRELLPSLHPPPFPFWLRIAALLCGCRSRKNEGEVSATHPHDFSERPTLDADLGCFDELNSEKRFGKEEPNWHLTPNVKPLSQLLSAFRVEVG